MPFTGGNSVPGAPARGFHTPRAIPFTVWDHGDFLHYTEALRSVGIGWTVETGHPDLVECGLLTSEGGSAFRVWRSASGLHFREARPPEAWDGQAFATAGQVLAQMVGVMSLRQVMREMDSRPRPWAVDLLPDWLRGAV